MGPVEGRGELPPRADLELAIHVREVHLNRLHRDEERLSDLSVAQLFGSQLSDAPLARRQRIEPGQKNLARTGTGRGQLVVRTLDQRGRATVLRLSSFDTRTPSSVPLLGLHGPRNELTFGWDVLAVALLGLAVYAFAIRSRLPAEQALEYVGDVTAEEPEAIDASG